jgi:hypothetical protein
VIKDLEEVVIICKGEKKKKKYKSYMMREIVKGIIKNRWRS